MNCAIIDIGSNTVKLSIYSVDENNVKTIYFKAEHMKLRAKIKNNCLIISAINELINLINVYKELAWERKAFNIFAFATASLRGLENSADVISTIKKECDIQVDLIDGETEAECSFLGVMNVEKDETGIVIDMGGASTELVYFDNRKIVASTSMPFGCLTLKNRFGNNREAVQNFVGQNLSAASFAKDTTLNIFIIGGSASSLKKLSKKLLPNENTKIIKKDQLEMLAKRFIALEGQDKEDIKLLLRERYDLFIPSAYALLKIADFIGDPQIKVTKASVRDGYLLKKKDFLLKT